MALGVKIEFRACLGLGVRKLILEMDLNLICQATISGHKDFIWNRNLLLDVQAFLDRD